jgi:DNA-directed RNA polymerase subunit H (RpoH/RPB5)
MDHQFKEDHKMVPRLKISNISQKENIFSTYLISITSLPEDEQTSKHGGGGRYNAILEFKGSN